MREILRVFEIDLRALALFRVCLAAILLTDLIIRATALEAHYTDFGLFPRREAVNYSDQWRFSVHFLNGSFLGMAFIFMLAGMVALLLLIGYRTRVVTFVCWTLLVSLHNRNPLLLQGGDNLLALLMFWGMFLPLGARYSVDSALATNLPPSNRFLSVAGAALLVQTMSVYFFSAFLKDSPAWIPEGTAIYYALHLDYFVTPIGRVLREFPLLMQGLTYYVWFLELLGPLLIFTRFFQGRLRTIVMILFVLMEVGFMTNLRIGLFPFISITSILLFVPTECWNRLARFFDTPQRRSLTLYHDDGCDFCRKTCLLLRAFLLLPQAQVAPAGSMPAVGELLERKNASVVVTVEGEMHTGWAGIAAMLALSPLFGWLRPLVACRLAGGIGNGCYNWIATREPWFAWFTERVLPYHQLRVQLSWFNQALALLFLLVITYWNITTINKWPFPSAFAATKSALRLDQAWNMFAPHPSREDGWFVVPGELINGTKVDLLSGALGAPVFDKPYDASDQFPTYRWRKYFTRIWLRRFSKFRLHYGRYLCRDWNRSASGDRRLSTFQLYFVEEFTQPEYRSPRIKRHLLWNHRCFASAGHKRNAE